VKLAKLKKHFIEVAPCWKS